MKNLERKQEEKRCVFSLLLKRGKKSVTGAMLLAAIGYYYPPSADVYMGK